MATFTEVKTLVGNWAGRTIDDGDLEVLIADAEERLREDIRVRKLSCKGTFTVTGEAESVPANYAGVASWTVEDGAGDEPHQIRLVSPDRLAQVQGATFYPETEPRYATYADGKFMFFPFPGAGDDPVETTLIYYREVPSLSDAEPTNWFSEEHPGLLRLAVLAETAAYLREDERTAMWEGRLEDRLEKLHLSEWNREFGVGATRRPSTVIG